MKVVVDTNVLVAGLLSPFGPPGGIVRMIAGGTLCLLLDARILTEYGDVLTRAKFRFDKDLIQIFLDQVKSDGHSVAARPLSNRLPDAADESFLEVALAGSAHCLVTGNTKHFPASRRQGIRVLNPREFLDMYRRKEQSRKS